GHGGEFDMRLKHILFSTLVGFAILFFQPNLANANTESTISEMETSTIEITIEDTLEENDNSETNHSTYSEYDETTNLVEDVDVNEGSYPEDADLSEENEINPEAGNDSNLDID